MPGLVSSLILVTALLGLGGGSIYVAYKLYQGRR
jgi:hypothetical protein